MSPGAGQPRYAILHSPACTAIWEVSDTEAPLWRYWAPRLPDGVTPGPPLRHTPPEPNFSLHFDQPLSLFPGLGLGWFGQSALLAHRAGRDWAQAITACRIEQPAPDTIRFHLADDVAHIAVTLTARLDPASDVLTLSTTLTNTALANTGSEVLEVRWLAPGEVRLAPGTSLTTPETLATCSAEGADGVAQAFHRAIGAKLRWPSGRMTPRPVHLNTWEGCYFDHDLTALKELADAAATIGIERFVLDDGWYGGRDGLGRRHDDTSSLGDWWRDASKYPDGLAPLADHVVGLGMEFSLWVEPEMVNPNSELTRAHSDWALAIVGRPLLTARNQLVLDLTLPQVRDYLFAKIAPLLQTLPIATLKWDHNRDLTHAGETPLYRRQALAAYALMARLGEAFPHIEIEACAGGGGRIDAGIIAHTHRFWTSASIDSIDAISRVTIQRHQPRLRLAVLLPDRRYRIQPAHADVWEVDGARAMRSGLTVPPMQGEEVQVWKVAAL